MFGEESKCLIIQSDLQQLPVPEEKEVTPTEGTWTQKVAGADGNTSNTRQVERNRQQGKLFSHFLGPVCTSQAQHISTEASHISSA